MSERTVENQRYMVRVIEASENAGSLIFTFVPKSPQQEHGTGIAPNRPPQFVVAVRQEPDGLTLDWARSPDDPGSRRDEIQAEIAARMQDREGWIDRVTTLVDGVERWAKEMDWATRRLEKTLDDARIGKHTVSALLMQKDTCRVLLEPVGRSSPGADGVIELYLMPAYDDIATLYYYENRWNVHYSFLGSRQAATVRDAQSMPLSKETLEKVLAEMTQHAA